jgi:hypothetical protein
MIAGHVVPEIEEHGASKITGHGEASSLKDFIITRLVIWIMYFILS